MKTIMTILLIIFIAILTAICGMAGLLLWWEVKDEMEFRQRLKQTERSGNDKSQNDR